MLAISFSHFDPFATAPSLRFYGGHDMRGMPERHRAISLYELLQLGCRCLPQIPASRAIDQVGKPSDP